MREEVTWGGIEELKQEDGVVAEYLDDRKRLGYDINSMK